MQKKNSLSSLAFLLVCLPIASTVGGERPTLNATCDPRPDILPYSWHNSIPEYRRVHNRPRFWSGWVAQQIAPSSQEAMVWCENLRTGAYDTKHAPPRYKRFYGPKPWEVLQTGARPDFARPEATNQFASGSVVEAREPNLDRKAPAPLPKAPSEMPPAIDTPVSVPSPSDRG
ncbi:MAG: hypothetical protein AB8B50_19890 [Pirellulaceae bacterium]